MKNLKTFNDLVDFAANYKGESIEKNCKLSLEIDGEVFKAYAVYISNRDLLFLTDKGTLNYLIDSYGTRNVAELFNIETE